MKIRFVRTPPAEYSAYVEGEETDNLSDKDARYLITLGIAAEVRSSEGASTQHVSSRTEIVGADNQTEVVVTGRGANIKTVSDPEKAKLDAPGVAGKLVTDDVRRAASKEVATGLVKQEAARTGGFVDETEASLPSADEAEKAQTAEEKEAAARAKKAQTKAPENK